MAALTLFNETGSEIRVRLRLVEGHGRFRGRSPTVMRADASTEVPIVVFSDVVRVPGREKTEYERLPEYPDESRVEVTVADGPSDTYYSSSGFGGIYVTI